MFKILVAPASYKGSIPAHRLAGAIASVCLGARPELDHIYGGVDVLEAPIADGGDDTLASLHAAIGGQYQYKEVIGPVGKRVAAAYLILDRGRTKLAEIAPAQQFISEYAVDTAQLKVPNDQKVLIDLKVSNDLMAIIELASASGIAYLTKEELDPLQAHTYGTGQLIEDAIAGGAKSIILALGGSASTDGGTGALSAMGAKFLDSYGQPVALGGGGLASIASVDLLQLRSLVEGVDFIVATDVTSPLLGPLGAASIFAPQKGADMRQIALLDTGLEHLASILAAQFGREKIELLKHAPGSGAAGGAAFGFAAILGAKVVSGFHLIADLLDLKTKVDWCDLLIVAEGKLDKQSVTGKGVGEIVSLAAMSGKKILALPALCDLTEAELVHIVGAAAGQILLRPTAPIVVSDAGTTYKMATLVDVQEAALIGLSRIIAGQCSL